VALIALHVTAAQQPRPPVVYTTPTRSVEISLLPTASGTAVPLKAQASYTLTSVGDDDSLTGTFTITLPKLARQKIAESTQSKIEQIAETYSHKNVQAKPEKGTACPSIVLELSEFDIDVTSGHLVMSGLELRIPESGDRLIQLLCFWTRQINAKRERLGIVRSINRMIEGDK
jgi:hypothetical protein